VRALASLTALTTLNLHSPCSVGTILAGLNWVGCGRVTNNGLQALTSLTALTRFDLNGCGQVSGEGLQELAGLTALTLV
jgi:hypothetical protein